MPKSDAASGACLASWHTLHRPSEHVLSSGQRRSLADPDLPICPTLALRRSQPQRALSVVTYAKGKGKAAAAEAEPRGKGKGGKAGTPEKGDVDVAQIEKEAKSDSVSAS